MEFKRGQSLLNRLGDDPDMEEIEKELKDLGEDDEEVVAVLGSLAAAANAEIVATGCETEAELDNFVEDSSTSAIVAHDDMDTS